MSSHETRQLGDVCIQDRVSVKAGERGDLRYIGLEGIEPETGSFIEGELSKTPDAPKANSFYFTSRHVLYGKLRPYLNKVATPEFEGKCSTEIIPLLPDESLNRDYLAYFLRSPQVVSRISRQTAGARMPRADMGVVLGLEIPVPSLSDQHSIVDILKRADSIRRLRKQAQDTARQLILALFIDMFGDPATNPRSYSVRTVGEIADVQGGLQVTRKRADFPIERPYLRVANVYRNRLDLSEVKTIRLTQAELERVRLQAGDLLVVEGHGNKDEVGRCAIWDASIVDCVHQNHLIRVRPNREAVLPEFLSTYLNSAGGREHLLRQGKTTSGLNTISTANVKTAPVFVPQLDHQKAFVERLAVTSSIGQQQETAHLLSESTFQSLLHKAFSGNL